MASMVVSSTGDRFRHDVAVREFALTVDEPIELGGRCRDMGGTG